MDLELYCPEKVVSAKTATSKMSRGNRVFLGTGCGEPQYLIRAMIENMSLQDMIVYQMLSSTLSEYIDDESFFRRFSLKLFFISSRMRRAAFEGKIDYIPTYLSQIPKLFDSQRIGLDVALVQVSPPDQFGYCSLGVSVDITKSGMRNSTLVIAQVNTLMPRTWGDSFVHVDDINYFVLHDEPIVEAPSEKKNEEISRRIGHYISQLVEDGATLQIGFGNLPNAVLKYLENKNDIGIHTQVITDGFLPLLKKKVINNKQKTLIPGRVVASLCMGTRELYDYVDNNPLFYFRSSEFVNDPNVIARNKNLISISSALEVDLTGQVCTDSMGYMFYSGIGDQVDFIRGSSMSEGGFSIIALPSTAQDGQISRIVSHLSEGAGVANTRGDVNFVVTEYGIAEIQGRGIYRRVMELAQVAHPRFRDKLIEKAKKHHYIFADQLPPSKEDLLFLENYKSTFEIENGKTLSFRPLLPSDEFSSRNFFYSLQEKTIYLRYFTKITLFPHADLQKQWAAVDYKKNMSIIGLAQKSGHKEIMAIGTYAGEGEGSSRAEVAFVVREDYQNKGVASYLIKKLEDIAKENNYTGFTAIVMTENVSMKKVFKKNYPNAVIKSEMGEIHLTMDFDE